VADIKADLEAGAVEAVLICGTSPRVDWDVFDFGDKVLVDRVNLREFGVLAYKNPDGTVPAKGEPAPDLLKMVARDYIKMGVMKLAKMKAPVPETIEAVKTVLVIGGGWTGLNAALSAAKGGYAVILVEKADTLGGKAATQYKTFPLAHPYAEAQDTGIEKLIAEVTGNSKIKVLTGTTLKELEGAPGKYTAVFAGKAGETSEPVGAVVLAAGWNPQDTEYPNPSATGP
jgi:quinone-modifying oxidoreductase subunit QmoB